MHGLKHISFSLGDLQFFTDFRFAISSPFVLPGPRLTAGFRVAFILPLVKCVCFLFLVPLKMFGYRQFANNGESFEVLERAIDQSLFSNSCLSNVLQYLQEATAFQRV
jgi:hypothetical protein